MIAIAQVAVLALASITLLAAAVAKVWDTERAAESLNMFELPVALSRVVTAHRLIGFEAIVGGGLLLGLLTQSSLATLVFGIAAAATYGVFAAIVWRAVRRGGQFSCACFGASAHEHPVSFGQAGRVGLLGALAFTAAAPGPSFALDVAFTGVVLAMLVAGVALGASDVSSLRTANRRPFTTTGAPQ